METKNSKDFKHPKVLPDGIKFKFECAKKAIGANFRLTISNYKKNKTFRNKVYTYFYKKLDIVKNEIFQNKKKDIMFLTKINCYRGIRHKISLPVRGQRTKTNAKTEKNKRNKKKFYLKNTIKTNVNKKK